MSHSTPEAEIVAADVAIKREGIPLLTSREVLNNAPQHPRPGRFYEDNETGARVMKTGRPPLMRHLGRTCAVFIALLSEQFKGIASVDR